MSTTSQRLDAARKENRELRQTLKDAHIALPYIPPILLSAIAELAIEMTQPTRQGDDLGIRVHEESEDHGQRVNARAAFALRDLSRDLEREARRIWTALERIGVTVMGDESGGRLGKIDSIIHGPNASNTRRSA